MKHNSGWWWRGVAEEKGQWGVQTHVDGRGPAINAFLYNSLLTAAACTGHHRPWRPLAVTNGAAFLQPTSNHLPAPSWHSLWCFTFTASWRWGFCSGSMMISFLKLYFNCQSALAAQINHHTPHTTHHNRRPIVFPTNPTLLQQTQLNHMGLGKCIMLLGHKK